MNLGTKKTDANYGRGSHTIEDDSALIDRADLSERLLSTFRAPNYCPPVLPKTALELVSVSRKPNVSVPEIVKLLEQDSMLATRVLQVAQSPFYGSVQLKSLKDAVTRIGLRQVSDLVLQVAMNMRVFKSTGYQEAMEKLRIHSTVTAHLSKIVCRYTSIDGDYAFLCGLLNNVGIAGILLALGDTPKTERRPDLDTVWPAIEDAHEEASGILARLWNLPMEIQMVVAHHHKLEIGGYPHPLVAVLLLADEMAHKNKVIESPLTALQITDTRGRENVRARARELLGITEKTEALMQRDAEKVLSQWKAV